MHYLRDDQGIWREVDKWARRQQAELRVLQAMAAAGLDNRERDVYWLRVGCLASYREIGHLMPHLGRGHHGAGQAAFRVFQVAEDKLAEWVTAEGITASPLFREPNGPKAVTALALRVRGSLGVAVGGGGRGD